MVGINIAELKPRICVAAAWLSLILALSAMLIGHLDAGELSWTKNNVSTYAARAANDDWITAAMLLAASSLLCIAFTVVRHGRLAGTVSGGLVAALSGSAVSGLLLLSAYEETAAGGAALAELGVAAIRQQSFHDAGLFVFFYSSILALFTAGTAIVATGRAGERILGAIVAASGLVSYAAMRIAWPAAIGFAGPAAGLRQRAAFVMLWLGAVLLLAALARPHKGPQRKS